jgi:hypothetical protein
MILNPAHAVTTVSYADYPPAATLVATLSNNP